jgi:hypothetical protein
MNNVQQYVESLDKPVSADTTKSSPLYTVHELPDFPEISWLIDDVLPNSGLASVYGPSGVGKSFICLDMACHLAMGKRWFGHETRACNVVYISLEGQRAFYRRIKAWMKKHEVELGHNIRFYFDQFELNDPTQLQVLASEINKVFDGNVLIILDTLNKTMPGLDENSSVDMGKIISAASTLQRVTDSMVLLVHHSGKDATRGLRGHSSLFASLDAVIETERDGINSRWRLVKSKDSEDGIGHSFTLEEVELGHNEQGKEVKSCVIQEVEGAIYSKKATEPRGENQKIIWPAARNTLLLLKTNAAGLPDQPEGISFDDLVEELKDVLTEIDPKHRQLRTKEAIAGLIRRGNLTIMEDLVYLPES